MSVGSLRSHFPALRDRPDGPTPAYLDSACMSLVPVEVLDAMEEYYRDYPGCAGRSLHRYAEEVGHRYEAARAGLARFLGAESPDAVVFLRNASEAINLVAQGLAWNPGDAVLISDQEHNSNLIVWQRLAQERGIRVEVLDLPPGGGFPTEAYESALKRGVRLVSLFHTSNLDGRSLPVREIVERAHAHGARVLLDGCQAAPHVPVHLKDWGVDYYAVSAHKMLGPTGTGALIGTARSLGDLRPLLVGGETVEWSTLTEHELRPPPHRFEAGLQNYAGVLGAHAAVKFLEQAGLDETRAHDEALNRKVTKALEGESRVHLLGPTNPSDRPSIFAFHLDGVDANDAALFLDEGYQVLVRSGMHCVHSWYRKRNLPGNVRASFYMYNDDRDVDRLIDGVREMIEKIPV
ncbi:MAG: cysteine desulfurase [Thermoplasmata archaeon]|nr:cysteine desulfurase [Thermoplasmata archaeon]